MLAERVGVDAVRVIDRAEHVGDCHNLHAGLVHEPGGTAADLTEALHGDGGILFLDAEVAERRARREIHAQRRRLSSPERTAKRDRLSGHDARLGVAHGLRVGVHKPRHRLGVGAHVGRGDVNLRADHGEQLVHVAAGDALDLSLRVFGRIEGDATLRAAVGQVEERGLPRHEHGQRTNLFHVHALRIAHAALARATAPVVLNAVAAKDGLGAVVALDRHSHGDFAAGCGE